MFCEYCNSKFISNTTLKHHQKTAKYCLSLRGKNNKYKCKECNKILTTKHRLQTHKQSCIEYRIKIICKEYEDKLKDKDKLLFEYKKQISELQTKLENIAIKAVERPTTTYQDNRRSNINQIINNLQPITEEYLKEQAQYLTFDHIKRGIPGYVEYALEYPLKDRIICVDFSRRKIKYKDTDENVITDPEMTKLSHKLFSAIAERNKTLILHYLDEMSKKVFGNIDDEKSEEEDKILEESRRINDYKMGVFKSSKGDLTDFQKDFVKGICTKVSSS
jgi:hypothetical protein